MNREQALAKAKNLRKRNFVAILIGGTWEVTKHPTINAAKRAMRAAGIGVALHKHERLPEHGQVQA